MLANMHDLSAVSPTAALNCELQVEAHGHCQSLPRSFDLLTTGGSTCVAALPTDMHGLQHTKAASR